MSNNLCPMCSARNKIVPNDHVIFTRIPGKRQITLEQIHFYQCSICDYSELTEESEKLVESVKNYYLKEYQNLEQEPVNTSFFSNFRNRRG